MQMATELVCDGRTRVLLTNPHLTLLIVPLQILMTCLAIGRGTHPMALTVLMISLPLLGIAILC